MSHQTPQEVTSHHETIKTLREMAIFGLVGVSGMFIDMSVVIGLRELFGVRELISVFPAFLIAVSWNYELNRRLTFQHNRKLSNGSFLSFVKICLLGLLFRWITMYALIHHLGMSGERSFAVVFKYASTHKAISNPEVLSQLPWLRLSYIANLAGIGTGFLFNFFGSKYFVFIKQSS